MADPPLIASGRSADVFDLGDGRVLRRRRDGRVLDHDIEAMRVARAAGYPVPEVIEVRESEVVLERVAGEAMLDRLTRRPWQLVAMGRRLGELHRDLERVPIDGADLPTRSEPAEVVVHGDLHPSNVLLAPAGPTVIDWENAGVGCRGHDAATTWLITAIADPSEVPLLYRPTLPVTRRLLLRGFFSVVDRPDPAVVSMVCDERLRDPVMLPAERPRIEAFREHYGSVSSSEGRGPTSR